jgi:glycosyltransferase involved in cell wall biosynthesis
LSEADGTTAAPLRVVLWGTYDTGKPRVRILLDGLRKNGVEVVECRADIWSSIQDKSQVKGMGRWLRLLGGIMLAYPGLLWRYLRLPRHDWVLLGYPAIPDIFVIRVFAWLRGARVAMDWFLSAYDTVVLDRRLVGRRHPLAMVLWGMEWLAIRLADVVFMDTRAHGSRIEILFGLRAGTCGSVWVGVEEAAFDTIPNTATASAVTAEPMRVLFYGQFIPLHGLPTIVEAARLLRDQPVDWLIIGRGQETSRVREMLQVDPLPRLRTLDWVDYAELRAHIGAADVCLGIFGTSDKAASVIPNKAFQILAAGKPLITRDSPAIRELIGDAQSDIALVEAGDARALVDALLAWRDRPPQADPRRVALVAGFLPSAIGRQCIEMLMQDRAS